MKNTAYVEIPSSPLTPRRRKHGLAENLSTPAHKRPRIESDSIKKSTPAHNKGPLDDSSDTDVDELQDEVNENAYLVLEGETPVSEDSEKDVPVRLLNDLSVRDGETNEPVLLEALLEINKDTYYIATGFAMPWVANSEDDSEDSDRGSVSVDDGPRFQPMCIRTSRIIEMTFYFFDREANEMDRNIYIRTEFAWYILGVPSDNYSFYFRAFWKSVRLLHLVVREAMTDPRLTYEEFLELLPQLSEEDDEVASVQTVLGRNLSQADVEEDNVRAFFASAIEQLCEDSGIKLKRSPLLKRLMPEASYRGLSAANATTQHSQRPGVRKNLKTTLPKQSDATVITPMVGRIAESLFNNCFRVVGDSIQHEVSFEIATTKEHHENPKSIAWGEPAAENDNYYTCVVVDGVTYRAGDVVMVIPGEDTNRVRAQNDQSAAAQSANQYGNQLWFCQIFYFFEEKNMKLFHGQWLVHGAKTILQEAAHSKSLFLIDSCATNPVASIFKKCHVRFLSKDEKEPVDDLDPKSEDYHCGFRWDEEHAAFINLPTETEYKLMFAMLPTHRPCFSCGSEAARSSVDGIRQLRNGFSLPDTTYHIHDFVYLKPTKDTNLLLEIVQIVHSKLIDEGTTQLVQVRFLGRYDDYLRARTTLDSSGMPSQLTKLTYDERRLYLTTRVGEVDVNRLDGRCFVHHLEDEQKISDWIRHDDHYYLNQKGTLHGGLFHVDESDLYQCSECLEEEKNKIRQAKRFLKRNSPLRGLELFSGAGGLGTGINMSGFVETRWAVEYMPAAAKTYARNHPNTIVYCQDSSLLLKHAIDTHRGEEPPRLLSNDGRTRCPLMPGKDEVDFIFGGPPCQSFSGANHNKQADDIRSTMPCNMLSFLEHYNADFLLLENVRGLLNHPLLSEQNGRVLSGGIKSGVVKFIMRTLVALGYQVHWKVLQAGQYGTPQNRERVIFWAAKRSLPLPKHPVPVYAWKKGAISPTLPIGTKMPPPTRSLVPGGAHQYAPLRPITVSDAISDLPKFDWVNPHTLVKQTRSGREYLELRLKTLCIPRVDAVFRGSHDFQYYPGYPEGIDYPMKPQNRYQGWLRQEMGADEKVQGHYTKRFSERLVEATTTVPLEEGADHRDLPPILQPNIRIPDANRQKRLSFFGRLSPDGHFTCTMTTLTPGTKNARPLHPNQMRMVTVRECARAQGFPDHYVFESTSAGGGIYDDQIKQIGNAVPVPLALALGKELGKALVKLWEDQQRESSPVV